MSLLTSDVRKALAALGTVGESILKEMEKLEASTPKAPSTKKQPTTRYYKGEERCATCGEKKTIYFTSDDDGRSLQRLEDGAGLLANVEVDQLYYTRTRTYCEECLMALDDVPRSSLVWLIESILPLVRGDKTSKLIDTLQKGLGFDEDFRSETARERRRGQCRSFNADPLVDCGTPSREADNDSANPD